STTSVSLWFCSRPVPLGRGQLGERSTRGCGSLAHAWSSCATAPISLGGGSAATAGTAVPASTAKPHTTPTSNRFITTLPSVQPAAHPSVLVAHQRLVVVGALRLVLIQAVWWSHCDGPAWT